MVKIMMPVEALDDFCVSCPFLNIETEKLEIMVGLKLVGTLNINKCRWFDSDILAPRCQKSDEINRMSSRDKHVL